MREVLDTLLSGWKNGNTAGLATVVRTFQSAPRPAGASMLVSADGTVAGSVSGGCVEGAVYELATQVAEDGVPVLVRYGISDDDAYAVGLTCGGILDVFVEPISRDTFSLLEGVHNDVAAGRTVGVATVIEHPDAAWIGRHLVVRPDGCEGSLGSERANRAIGDDTQGLLAAGRNTTLTYGPDGERRGEGLEVFFASYAPRPRLLVFGAIDFATALARLGTFLGYRVTVCDARGVFATHARFPGVDEVIVSWPDRYLREQIAGGLIDPRTVICVLTHDPKFDVPLLETALHGPPVAYIGAMGSRRTHLDRLERLRQVGVTDTELARLRSPIGLDLGSRTPEETAVSIAAEIISLQWGGSGEPLHTLFDAIHHDDLVAPNPSSDPRLIDV
ncbi:XdhC family protein [Cryobacterium sp. PH31-L1]|uniref:XdhC family protein n=1 Tax=Cryobacterium sp. PH31-L1 TaxID=3046199 RepID=UPI0024BA4B85|nr:XdhC family protein [Cryobacterium sp. PH31-L1]MDJ0378573.1 XdhC family protein [Cryobacterium sp. PH31-L1]